MRVQWLAIVMIVFVFGACSVNENLTSVNENVTYVKDDVTSDNEIITKHSTQPVEDESDSDGNGSGNGSHIDNIANEHELMALPLLPEEYALPFEPLHLDQLVETELNSEWIHIKSLPFGQAGDTNIFLDIYEETTERDSYVHGVIEIGGKYYVIHRISTSLLTDHITCHEVCVYQHFFAGQDRYELIGAIELWSNGPGHFIFIINDVLDDALLTFSMWGNASFIDLDMDGQDEFVIEFPGLHLNPPDLAIIRAQNGILEMTGYVGQQLRTVEMNRDFAILKMNGGRPLIHISNMLTFSEQLYEEQSADYKYDDGVLRMAEEL